MGPWLEPFVQGCSHVSSRSPKGAGSHRPARAEAPGPRGGTTVVSAGKYGQLGHGDDASSDQPRRVEYLVAEGLQAEEVVCGPWTTYVCVLEP